MAFRQADIDRAIVTTQYELRGFVHPVGRFPPKTAAKFLVFTSSQFFDIAFGCLEGGRASDDSYVSYEHRSAFTYGEYLAMCERLAAACDAIQKEAVQLIIRDIVRQWVEMEAEVAAGTRTKVDHYLKPLTRENLWGRAVLAFAEAFEVNLEQAAVVPSSV